jgi:hypothetical protein
MNMRMMLVICALAVSLATLGADRAAAQAGTTCASVTDNSNSESGENSVHGMIVLLRDNADPVNYTCSASQSAGEPFPFRSGAFVSSILWGVGINTNTTDSSRSGVAFSFASAVSEIEINDISYESGNGNEKKFDVSTEDSETYRVEFIYDGQPFEFEVVKEAHKDALNGFTIKAGAVDTDPPTVSISGPDVVTGKGPKPTYTMTFTFNKPVTGFTIGGISFGNANTKSAGLQPVTDTEDPDGYYTTYTVDKIKPKSGGQVVVRVRGNVATDADGTGNAESAAYTTQYDSIVGRPTVEITAPDNVTNDAAFDVTFKFSEVVKNFDANDIKVANGVLSAFEPVENTAGSSNYYTTYAAKITPDGSKENITIDVAQGAAKDAVDELNTAANQVVVKYGSAPTITDISPKGGSIKGGTEVKITGTGFTGATGVTFGGTTGTGFTVKDDSTITVITPEGTGTVEVVVQLKGG